MCLYINLISVTKSLQFASELQRLSLAKLQVFCERLIVFHRKSVAKSFFNVFRFRLRFRQGFRSVLASSLQYCEAFAMKPLQIPCKKFNLVGFRDSFRVWQVFRRV